MKMKTLKLKGLLEKNPKGFGFIAFSDRAFEDLYLPEYEAQHYLHGDRLEVTISDPEGEVLGVKLLNRRYREVVGRYWASGSGHGSVVLERRKTRETLRVKESAVGHFPEDGHWVRASLIENDGTKPAVKIEEIFGEILPASQDVQMIAREFDLEEAHSPASVKEAEGLAAGWKPEVSKHRKDFREMPFMTIDGETARDFDDAVYVERTTGGYKLWVAIADVSDFVREGSELDREARGRATSVYFPERAFHMLPRALSENLCSLRPREPRHAMVAEIDYDRQGARQGTKVHEAVIESKRRATYTEIQAEADAHPTPESRKGWELEAAFALYSLLRKQRSTRGSIDFELPEAEVIVDAQGEPLRIESRPRQDSHRLIEEFMIGANEAVTAWIEKKHWPFVYRVHEVPSEKAMRRFFDLVAGLGIEIGTPKVAEKKKGKKPSRSQRHGPRGESNAPRFEPTPRAFADFLKGLHGNPAEKLLNISLLRSMKQAVYAARKEPHFGLASEGYTHFTSPIRRYPDLVVHRLLRAALRGDAPQGKERDKLQRALDDVTDHCSYRERLAAEADREAIRLKQARFMHKHLGKTFEAEIIGFSESGILVRTLDPFTEGFVLRDSLDDDFYHYNESRMIYEGRRTRNTYHIGDRIKVQVLKTDLERRLIDFGIESAGGNAPRPKLERSDKTSSSGVRISPVKPRSHEEPRGGPEAFKRKYFKSDSVGSGRNGSGDRKGRSDRGGRGKRPAKKPRR